MKVKLIASIVSSALLSTTLAYAMPPEPEKCPGVGALKSVAFAVAEQDSSNKTWAVGVISNKYDTKDKWTFVIGKIPAKNEKDAYTKAADAVKSLTFNRGPIAIKQYNIWGCVYTAKNYPSAAVTPALGLKPVAQWVS